MIAIQDITVDAEFETLLSPLSADEFNGLRDSILKDGFTDPLIVWLGRGTLVDGHNRLKVFTDDLHGDEHREPQIIEKPFEDREAVKEFILRRQLSRRNLTDAMRIKVTLQLKPFIKAKAKSKQIRKPNSVSPTLAESIPGPVDTRKELAEMAGVSQETFRKAEAVLKGDMEDLKDAMLQNKVSINKAFKTIKPASPVATTPPEPVDEKQPECNSDNNDDQLSISSLNTDDPEWWANDYDSGALESLKRSWNAASREDRLELWKCVSDKSKPPKVVLKAIKEDGKIDREIVNIIRNRLLAKSRPEDRRAFFQNLVRESIGMSLDWGLDNKEHCEFWSDWAYEMLENIQEDNPCRKREYSTLAEELAREVSQMPDIPLEEEYDDDPAEDEVDLEEEDSEGDEDEESRVGSAVEA